jgi:hypothetical protein
MEDLLSYVNKIEVDENLIKSCHLHLMTLQDFRSFIEMKDDWRLHLKISIEYDVLYDKLYIGSYSDVPDDYKRMFLILSFLKVKVLVSWYKGLSLLKI